MHTFSGGSEGIAPEARIHSKVAMGFTYGMLILTGYVVLLGLIRGESPGETIAQCVGLQ